MSEIVKRIEQFAKNQDITISEIERKISASKGVLYKAVKNNTDISAKWIGALVENYPILSANYILTGKGDMLLPSGEHQEPAAVPHKPAGEQPACKSGDKSPMLVADEPQGYYPTSPTEQVLRQLISALERTIKDKEKNHHSTRGATIKVTHNCLKIATNSTHIYINHNNRRQFFAGIAFFFAFLAYKC